MKISEQCDRPHWSVRRSEPWAWQCPDCAWRNLEEDAPDYGKQLVCQYCGKKYNVYEEEK